jgi:hypothetical protein
MSGYGKICPQARNLTRSPVVAMERSDMAEEKTPNIHSPISPLQQAFPRR